MCEQNQKSQEIEGFGSAAMKQQAEIPRHVVQQERARQLEAEIVASRQASNAPDGVYAALMVMVAERLRHGSVQSDQLNVEVTDLDVQSKVRVFVRELHRAMRVMTEEIVQIVVQERQASRDRAVSATREELLLAVAAMPDGLLRVDGQCVVNILAAYRRRGETNQCAMQETEGPAKGGGAMPSSAPGFLRG